MQSKEYRDLVKERDGEIKRLNRRIFHLEDRVQELNELLEAAGNTGEQHIYVGEEVAV